MTVDVRTSLRTPRLISRNSQVYNRVLILVVLKELELVILEKQIQSLIIELSLSVTFR